MVSPQILTTLTPAQQSTYDASVAGDHAAHVALAERTLVVARAMATRFDSVADHQRLVTAMESVVYALDEEQIRLPYPAASSVMRDLLLANPAQWADVCAPPRPLTLPTPWWTLAWWQVTPKARRWGRVQEWVGRIVGKHPAWR